MEMLVYWGLLINKDILKAYTQGLSLALLLSYVIIVEQYVCARSGTTPSTYLE